MTKKELREQAAVELKYLATSLEHLQKKVTVLTTQVSRYSPTEKFPGPAPRAGDIKDAYECVALHCSRIEVLMELGRDTR